MDETDSFDGWEMASVGCHWSRALPDGRMVYMSSGSQGYSLTVNYVRSDYQDLTTALAAYGVMASSIEHASGVREVFDAETYRAAVPTADVVTDGQCGRSWDDNVSTAWTPAPSARCPFEYEHGIPATWELRDPDDGGLIWSGQATSAADAERQYFSGQQLRALANDWIAYRLPD